MKKRIFAVILAATMFLPLLGVSAAFDDVTDETQYAGEIEMLAAIGVISGDENNNFDPEGEMTRADFAMIIGNIFGYNNSQAATQVFSDVPQNHYAASAIAALTGSGVFSGVGGGLFEPDTPVTYPQAAKVLVSITGYQQAAEAAGGWPTGYLIQASNISISGNFEQDQPLTRAQLAHLIYQALRVDLRQQTVVNNTYASYAVVRGETLLTNVMQIYMLKNVTVNDTYKTSSRLNERQVMIGGQLYAVGDTNAADYIGQNVTIYYQTDIDALEERRLLYITQMPQNTEVTIQADDLVSFSDNEIKYVQDGRTERVVIGSDADILYNGRSVLAYDTSLFNIESGSIRLSSSDGGSTYNLVEIEAYENILVGGIDYQNKVIYDRYDRNLTVRVPDDTTAVCEVMLPDDNTIYEFEDISEGQLISVFTSQDGQYIKIIFGGDPITATVDEITDDEIVLNGTAYLKASSLERMPAIELGGTYTFFLDIDGRVAARSSDTSGQQYGFLIDAATKDGINTEMQIKLLTDMDEIQVLGLASSVKLNGSTIKPATTDGRAKLMAALQTDHNAAKPGDSVYTENGIVSQLVTYQVNAAGAVNELNTAAAEQDSYSFSLDFSKNSLQYKSGIKTFRMKFMASTNTKVFVVPSDGSVEDENFESVATSWMVNDHTYQVAAYDVDDGGAAGAIVIWDNVGGAITSGSNFAVVDKVVSAVKEDGTQTKKLYGISSGKYIELIAEELGTLTVTSNGVARELRRGDGIRYATNKNGEVSTIALDFDVARPYSAQQTGTLFSIAWSTYGTVYSKEGNNFIMTTKVAESIEESLFENRDSRISFPAAGNIYIYDVEKDEVSRTTVDDIFTYMMSGEHASRIYVRFRYETVQDILIYKE